MVEKRVASASQIRAGVAAALVPVALAGCVIIVEPDDGVVPVPVPVPLVCDPTSEAPVAHVYFSMRIERSTVNLEPYLTRFMQRVVLGLAGAGIQAGQVVLVRADERPGGNPLLAAWGCRLDNPEVLRPEDVLRFYAVQESLDDDAEPGCATDPVAYLGGALGEVVTQYPRALDGTSGLSVFGSAPDLVLVVHIDPLERRAGFDAPACASAQRLVERDADGRAAWLAYAGDDPAADRVVHWTITTPERVSRATFIDDCRAQEGFPSEVLDLIEPSAEALYGPLLATAEQRGFGVRSLGFCEMLADDRDFLIDGSLELGRRVGLSVDEQQVIDVLDNGLPVPGSDDEDGVVLPPDIVVGD